MRNKAVGFLLGLFWATGAVAQSYSVADVEALGFQRGQQQIFQMIGAIDGWSGTFEGDVVELYAFPNDAFEIPLMMKNATHSGNISGWVEMCRFSNLLMLSKGARACPALKRLPR